jgi:hypothetical protein
MTVFGTAVEWQEEIKKQIAARSTVVFIDGKSTYTVTNAIADDTDTPCVLIVCENKKFRVSVGLLPSLIKIQ